MLDRILPPEIDDRFEGSRHAVWMLVLITLGNFFLAGAEAPEWSAATHSPPSGV